MSKAKIVGIFTVFLWLLLFHPQNSWAERKNSEFFDLPRAELEMYVFGAVDMAGHIAALRNREQGRCIWDWLAEDFEQKKDLIIRGMEKYPDSSPTGVAIALVERHCGKFPRLEVSQ